jgi:Tol biopolymer transport system component
MKTFVLVRPNGSFENPAGISADGRYLISETGLENDVGGESQNEFDLTDLQTGDTQDVANTTGETEIFDPTLSPDGEFVAYLTRTPIQNGQEITSAIDVFDRATGETRSVFSQTAPAGSLAPDIVALSPDDQSIFFVTGSIDLGLAPADLSQLNLQTGSVWPILQGFTTLEGISGGGQYFTVLVTGAGAGAQLDRVGL